MPTSRLLILLSLLAAPACPAAEDKALRAALEKTYHDWRSALVNSDLAAWQRATSKYRQMVTRNLIISGNQPYPDAIFQIPLRPPEITNLRLLEAETKAATAHLVYFGKVDLGVEADKIPENILILKFIKEGEEWRFDTTRFMNLEGVPDVRASLQNGVADFLDKPEFNPSGVVPPTPAPCGKPEYVATLQIQSFGYETAASLNGFEYAAIADNAEQQLIIGGLAKGENSLKLKIKPLPVPEGVERLLEVGAIVLTGRQDKPGIQVFSWEHKSAEPPSEITLPVWVNRTTLKE